MGNLISRRKFDTAGKLILSDGTVHKLNHPLTVAELMLDYPRQVVVEYHPIMNGNKPTPLPADKKLDMKKAYLMLPMKRGNSTFTADEARQILLKADAVLKSGSFMPSKRILTLFARILPVRNEVVLNQKDDGIVKEEEEECKTLLQLLPEVFEDQQEFLSRQFSGKGWKPSLDTIKEKKIDNKVPHWLF